MIRRQINLKKTRLKQARKPVFTQQKSNAFKHRVVKNKKVIRQKHPSELNSYFIENTLLRNQFRGKEVEFWVANRILDFLNRAQSVNDLTEAGSEIENYSIGKTIAERILKFKMALAPFSRFTALSQLEHIDGFGIDKFNDLIRLLAIRADDAFKKALRKELLPSNWKFNIHQYDIASAEEFEQLAKLDNRLKEFVGERIYGISFAAKKSQTVAKLAKKIMHSSYAEQFRNQEYATIALAFWFYRVDGASWFSLNQMIEKTKSYFAHYDRLEHRLELVLFKGFPNDLALVNPITTSDLAVVINYGEQSISILTIKLND